MRYNSELHFFEKLLDNLKLNHVVLTEDTTPDLFIDFGLRNSFGLEVEYERLMDFITQTIKPNTFYLFSDNFFCKYIAFQLPETEKTSVFLIGPYTEQTCTEKNIYEAFEKFHVSSQIARQMLQYYSQIPYIADSTFLISAISTVGEILWGSSDQYSFVNGFHSLSEETFQKISENLEPMENLDYQIQLIEKRYAAENRFLQNISQGNIHKVDSAFSNSSLMDIEPRIPDSLRNFKNYCIIMNTLLRKAVEQGAVHPIHIDQLSSSFAQKIELIRSLSDGKKLMKEMVHKYSLLVKNHSMKGYSLLIQKVITIIDMDITSDLSLSTLAGTLNINPSYLSTLFKKETGQTLTDYVNEHRIQYGIFLLNSTQLQVQSIAQHCGISDINYFTRIFKKYTGMTPTEYRNKVTL